MALKLDEVDRSRLQCTFRGSFRKNTPHVMKIHHVNELKKKASPRDNLWIFLTGVNGISEAAFLRSEGYNVRYVADTRMVSVRGEYMVFEYQKIFSLSDTQMTELFGYMWYWDVIRLCCGKQMSQVWRLQLNEETKSSRTSEDVFKSSETSKCAVYNISAVEREFMRTQLYQKIANLSNLQGMNRPSVADGELDGDYCHKYNEKVKKLGIGFNQG